MRRLVAFCRENWLSLLLLTPFTAVVLGLGIGGVASWVDGWDSGSDASRNASEGEFGEDFCADGISWVTAANHVGETVSVFGTVERVSQPAGVTGNPTFLEIGNAYPNPSRLNGVIWGQDASSFDSDLESAFEGETVCLTGEIETYNGVPQITLRDPSQIESESGAAGVGGDDSDSGCLVPDEPDSCFGYEESEEPEYDYEPDMPGPY